MSNTFLLNDSGIVLEVTVKKTDGSIMNISDATTKNIVYVKPNGTHITKAASFTTNGTDGKLRYTVVDGDLDTIGRYIVYIHVESSTYKRTSFSSWFEVINIS